MLIGVDYHPSFQHIVFFDEETGECGERVATATASGHLQTGFIKSATSTLPYLAGC